MRGTFVFPAADQDFMQLIELRGNNGATEDVETVFVLTGETYFVPTRLFAFDDPGLYLEATRTTVHAKDRSIARTVAGFYRDRAGPKQVTRVHTHPGGNTTPSETDKSVGESRKRLFDRYFEDYEFFLAIHALQDHCDPDPDWLRRPEQTAANTVSWWGENRRHTLGLFDEAYEPRPVVVR